MNSSVIRSVESLKKAIDEDPRVLKLNELDKKISLNEEVKRFSMMVKNKEEEYSSLLSQFGEKNESVIAKRRELYEAKLALDSLPLTKEYFAAFVEVRDLYLLIDDILFSPFRKKVPHVEQL